MLITYQSYSYFSLRILDRLVLSRFSSWNLSVSQCSRVKGLGTKPDGTTLHCAPHQQTLARPKGTASPSHSVLAAALFLVHLCNSRSIHTSGRGSGSKYSMADQAVPMTTGTPTGTERISIRLVITLLSMRWKTNSRRAKRQANSHANAVYLSKSKY